MRTGFQRLAAGGAVLIALAAAQAPARASISPVAAIDGPSASIVELGGVAMAADGTGGLVYRRRDADGRTHIYASQFDGTGWRPARRVDAGQRFDSSWPAIAAAAGGRLVVVWVQELGVSTDRLFAATLDPGARGFLAPVPVDLNVGEATATWPTVAMNRAGTAYVVYRVVSSTAQTNTSLPPGTVDGDYRIARTSGQYWSVIGQPVDRNPAAPQADPDALNRPRIGVDVTGNAVVAWHEPDDRERDRVWARRVFGGTLGIPLQVSPSERDGVAIAGRVDQFSLDVAGFGQAVVGYRELAEGDGALAGARIWTNAIPESFSDGAAKFTGARLADGGPPSAAQPLDKAPGPVTVTTTAAGVIADAFSIGPASLVVGGDDRGIGAAKRLDDASSSVPGDPVVEAGPDGASAYAWKLQQGRLGGVAVRELRADGVPTTRVLSAAKGGAVGDLVAAGSGLGDAALAWIQGAGDGTQIAAATVDAPPSQFAASAPLEWVRTPAVKLTWDTAPHAIGGVTYDVTVDDEQVLEGLKGTRAVLNGDAVGDGRQTVVVIARDAGGQETESVPAELLLDRRAPAVTVRPPRRDRVGRVTISDGEKGTSSGASAAGTTVSWGDGRRTRGRVTALRHRYTRPGRYRVTVSTRDRAGNRRTVRRSVLVR